ncbi:hypothetical protein KOW79_019849 [Hemibagrus wyckioides]|uniref:Uncharacterized protein n=1 Tax=Hemibagrus wyckioides TaxID=337641 RepID=A0A9D3SDZ7_9TELE|nr:hypothetical protein KOW79_019849 [Hemibagrus wyckioides]
MQWRHTPPLELGFSHGKMFPEFRSQAQRCEATVTLQQRRHDGFISKNHWHLELKLPECAGRGPERDTGAWRVVSL